MFSGTPNSRSWLLVPQIPPPQWLFFLPHLPDPPCLGGPQGLSSLAGMKGEGKSDGWAGRRQSRHMSMMPTHTCLPTRATTKPQTSLEMTDPHQGLETGICACLKSCHCGLTLSFSAGLDSLLLSLSLNPELKTLRVQPWALFPLLLRNVY